ncbi:hypothetical protein K4F52_008273 [Lecanicillium sp. MT-2017a]|nr:hypothetical protein K4F52_008273 [Lecanicillium sp. MT-2017a]
MSASAASPATSSQAASVSNSKSTPLPLPASNSPACIAETTTSAAIAIKEDEDLDTSSAADSTDPTSATSVSQSLASTFDLSPSSMAPTPTTELAPGASSSESSSSSIVTSVSSSATSEASSSTSTTTSTSTRQNDNPSPSSRTEPSSPTPIQKPAQQNQQPPPASDSPDSGSENNPPSSQGPQIEAEPTSAPNPAAPEAVQSSESAKAPSPAPPVKVENGKPTSAASSEGLPTTLESEILDPARTEPAGDSSAPSSLVFASSAAPTPSLATSISLSFSPVSGSSRTGGPSIVLPTGAGTGRNTPGGEGTPAGDIRLQTDTEQSGPPMSAIIGGSVGGVALLALIGVLIWLWRRKSRRGESRQPLTPLSGRHGDVGDTDRQARAQPSEPVAPSGGILASLPPWSRSPFSRSPAAAATSAQNVEKYQPASAPSNNSSLVPNWWESAEKEPVALQQPQQTRPRGTSVGNDEAQPGGRGPAANPFSDAHAVDPKASPQPLRGILKPPSSSVYSNSGTSAAALAALRRSRAHSVSAQRSSQATNTFSKLFSSRRTSSLTNDPFEDRRIKFRSDPFDLEFDLLSSSTSNDAVEDPMPQPLDPRTSSIYSSHSASSGSRYTSGATVSNWAGAGPMAPAVVGQVPGDGPRDSPTLPLEPPLAARATQVDRSVVGQAL